jgi:hypothetical protein
MERQIYVLIEQHFLVFTMESTANSPSSIDDRIPENPGVKKREEELAAVLPPGFFRPYDSEALLTHLHVNFGRALRPGRVRAILISM